MTSPNCYPVRSRVSRGFSPESRSSTVRPSTSASRPVFRRPSSVERCCSRAASLAERMESQPRRRGLSRFDYCLAHQHCGAEGSDAAAGERAAFACDRERRLTRDVWLYALCTASRRVSAGSGRFCASEVGRNATAGWRHLCVTVRMDSNARPRAGTRGAVAATAVLDCDAAERAPRIHGDHSHAACSRCSRRPAGPLRVARRARPHHAANRAAPRRRVPAPSWPSRPHAHHSSPHPRAVQLLLLDQQIAPALPLAQ